MMSVRRAAIDQFGLGALAPGEPVANLRRRFVPIWLLHRYQVVAAAKAIGGVDFSYAVNGGGHERCAAGAAADAARGAGRRCWRRSSPDALRVPDRLVPLLSAARNGSDNRQYRHRAVRRPPAARCSIRWSPPTRLREITLNALLAPARLARARSAACRRSRRRSASTKLLDRLLASDAARQRTDALTRRIAYRTIVTLAQVAREQDDDARCRRDARRAACTTRARRSRGRHGDAADRAWAASLSRQLLDPRQRERAGSPTCRA